MSSDSQGYVAVLKASYDYEPQSEDEVAIKEDQILFLLERVDDDWWKVKIKTDSEEDESPAGLVPAAYVEQAEHSSIAKALYDYDAAAPSETSMKEDEVLLVFGSEDDWMLVQAKEGGRAGYVPANYVEAISEDAEEEPSHGIVVPPDPPRPVSTYVDPADRVASTKVKADDIKTWAVSELDKKGKKKKGTLGIGNGAVFFASESDKTPVQKWSTNDVANIAIEKGKHVILDIGGDNATNLHFHAGSKDNAEAIVAKLASSKALSAEPSSRSPSQDIPQSPPKEIKQKQSVHFSQEEPEFIPPREDEDEPEGDVAHEEEDIALALYDFTADGEDELSITEGERLVILERDGDEWWKCRNSDGAEGVVPASYLDVSGQRDASRESPEPEPQPEPEPVKDDSAEKAAALARERAAAAERKAAERERAEAERQEKERQEAARKKADAQREAAAAAAAERKKRKEAADARTSSQTPPPGPSSKEKKSNGSSSNRPPESAGPPPDKVRTWHDRSGQFRVDAAFLGFKDGKLRLHKTNGVIVEVPSEKMSTEDMRYVEKMMSRKSSAPGPRVSEDDVPLGVTRAKSAATAPPPKKAPKIDWFDFFLAARCDIDDCTRYAASFERDKMDEALLPDMTESTMRSLGLREGDIIRVTKHIEKRKPNDNMQKPSAHLEAQIHRDAELAKQLQAQETGGTRSPAPNLFAGPGGVLKNPRRGRPQPTKSLPTNVDISAISSASEQIQRTTSPQAASPSKAQSTSSPQPAQSARISTPPVSGFGDDAWTNRPSSTKPTAAPTTTTSPPKASTPAPAPSTPAPAPVPAPAATTSPTSTAASPSLAKTTESDIFDQLARLSELRKEITATTPTPPVAPAVAMLPPNMMALPPVRPGGLGVAPSPVPMGQFQNGAGLAPSPSPVQYNGPRGPYAPVPANQGLLKPMVPMTTGYGGFIPTRPTSALSPFQPVQPQPTSNLSPFQPVQPQPSFLSQPPPTMAQQPLLPQQTGIFTMNPGLPYQNGGSFGPISPMLTGMPPGFNQPMNTGLYANAPPVPPLPNNNATNTAPANIFAQMKSGTFATDADHSSPQNPDKYNALRTGPMVPQATGWGQPYQGGYMGYQQ
ncbi:hypothetical protein BDN72DRAFT_831371 [Pluteus cervinus]|uniref:Uncharacterized protein n=1 Tax=Pluteus cervinus TaxID=181527 RepID=A0ACD3BCQ3_9AGAR|nr:hypothetical protein BDN72DRAFT_831371 [Pluteus cervinus]